MSIFNFRGNVAEVPQRGRTLKEISYAPSDIERREPLFQNGPNRVKIKGRYGAIYESWGYEFLTAREATNFWIENQRQYLHENSDYEPLEKFTRLRTRAEKEVDVQRVIDGVKAAFIPRFANALSRKGPWNDVVHGAPFEVTRHEEESAVDLKDRLTSAAGSDLLLLILATVCPDVIKAAINQLQDGETAEAFHQEQKKSAERSKVFMADQIRQATEFLKKIPRDE